MKETLSKKQKQRIAIIKDALKWITPKKVIAHNTYVKTNKTCKLGEDSKKVASRIKKNCEVCAKGALFLSTVALHNDFDFVVTNRSTGIYLPHYSIVDRMTKFFTRKQLDMVEYAFETVPNSTTTEPTIESYFGDKATFKAAKFGWQYKKDIDRLRAILKNMLDNNGIFKP